MAAQIAEFINAITRPLVTVICVTGLTWGFANRLISGEVYSTIVTAIIIYWFKQRDGEKEAVAVADAAADRVVARTVERRRASPRPVEHRRRGENR